MSNFKLQVTLSGSSVEEIVAALDAARAELTASKETPAVVSNDAPKEKPVAPKAKTPEPEPQELQYDYEKDVVPRVLKAVEACGKQFVSDTLARYGAKKASEVPPSWMPEFLARLEEGIDGAR